MTRAPVTGIGVGLRVELAADLLAAGDGLVDFVEIHPENHRDRGGAQATMLDRAERRFPILTHGLTMGFATAEPIAKSELRALREFLDRVEAPFHSDHFCFARAGRSVPHELLPPRFDDATVELAVGSIERMREAIGRPIAIENVSYYVPRARDPLAEVDALVEILVRADAKLLLDVNNVVVNAHNHGFDPRAYLARIPFDRIAQIHVAGHLVRPDGLRIDTHGQTSDDETRALLAEVLRRTGPVPVLLERDTDVPPFEELVDELLALRGIYETAVATPPDPQKTIELTTRIRRYEGDPSEGEPPSPATLAHAVAHTALAREPSPLGRGMVATRWSLYRSMVRGRLSDLVHAALPRTRAAIGDEAFEHAFTSFLDFPGPTEPVFWRVAVEFGATLLATLDGYERDVCRLDLTIWEIRQAPFDAAPPAEPFDFERPIVLDPAHLAFDADHPIDAADEVVARSVSKRRIVVVRTTDGSATILGLNPSAAEFLDRLRAKPTSAKDAALALVASRGTAIDAGFLDGLATMLAQWIELGFVRGVAPAD